MSTWATEKEKCLNMPLAEKREFYKVKKYITLAEVPTWKQLYDKKGLTLEMLNDSELSQSVKEKYQVNGAFNEIISIWQGDITRLEVDAIVNAANSALQRGGGVDGAIHRAAGPLLQEECFSLKGCETGSAKITGGYFLPAKHIIHAVGPRGERPDLLKSCYETSLKLLLENNLRTVAFPCISTGIYGYPQDKAAIVAIGTVRKFLEKYSDKVDRIIFTLFLDEDVNIYETLIQRYFPVK